MSCCLASVFVLYYPHYISKGGITVVSEREPQISSLPSLAHGSWWVSFCRWLRRVLGFVWGTLLVGIVIGTFANLNTTTTDTPLAKLFIVHLALTVVQFRPPGRADTAFLAGQW